MSLSQRQYDAINDGPDARDDAGAWAAYEEWSASLDEPPAGAVEARPVAEGEPLPWALESRERAAGRGK